MPNIPKIIYLQVGPDCPEDVDFKDLSEVSWNKHRVYDTDLAYYSPDAQIEGKAENELTGWFFTNLLRRPDMAEHIAVSLIDRGYGKKNTTP